MFGIKNARRTAGEDEFVVRGSVGEEIAGGAPVGLGDHDLILGDDFVEFSGTGEKLICGAAGSGEMRPSFWR